MKLHIFATRDSLHPLPWFANMLKVAEQRYYDQKPSNDIVEYHRMFNKTIDELLDEFRCKLHEEDSYAPLFLLRFS
jgi:hypothetical protein